MVQKFFATVFLAVILGITGISCSEDIPDCPSKMCVLAGGWKLTEVYIDNKKDESDFSKYRLILNDPAPTTAIVSDFNRTQASGNTDNGSWSVVNNGTILRLLPGNDPILQEDWIIDYFSPRKLILIINRDTGIKAGPSKIEFVLEPF